MNPDAKTFDGAKLFEELNTGPEKLCCGVGGISKRKYLKGTVSELTTDCPFYSSTLSIAENI